MGSSPSKPPPPPYIETFSVELSWKHLTAIPAQTLQEMDAKDESGQRLGDRVESLVLNFNELEDLDLRPWPHLRTLSLAANLFHQCPTHLPPSLIELEMGANPLGQFPSPILALHNLRHLHIAASQLVTVPSLSDLPALTDLSLAENQLTTVPTLPSSLVRLELQANALADIPTQILEPLFHLTYLNLSENSLTQFPALPSLTSLKQLILRTNELDALPEPPRSLSILDISFTPLATKFTPSSFSSLRVTAVGSPSDPGPRPSLIHPNLYLGDYLCAQNKALLVELGIRRVVTVAAFRPLFPSAFSYLCIDVDDKDNAPLLPRFEETYQFIQEGLETGGVLVHCRHGASRSVTVVAAYLLRADLAPSAAAALRAVKSRRTQASPNNGFRAQLLQYSRDLGRQEPLDEVFEV